MTCRVPATDGMLHVDVGGAVRMCADLDPALAPKLVAAVELGLLAALSKRTGS